MIGVSAKGTIILLSLCDCYITLGGTSKVVLDHSRILMDKGYDVVFLSPFRAKESDAFNGWWAAYKNGLFVAVVSTDELCVWEKHNQESIQALYVHHLRGIEAEDSLKLIDSLSCEILYYVHDFASICVTTTTAPTPSKPSNSFGCCGVAYPNNADCTNCAFKERAIANYHWYTNFFSRYRDRLTVIAPSAVAANIWKRAFWGCGIDPVVIPHLHEAGTVDYSCPKHPRLRLAFVGVDTPEKGGDAWRQIIRSHASDSFVFYHFGTARERFDNVTYVDVDFHQSDSAMTDALLQNEIDCALLWSVWPETYSFTYFECISAVAYIFTSSQSGNIASMVSSCGTGMVYDSVPALIESLGNASSVPASVRAYREHVRKRPTFVMSDGFLGVAGFPVEVGETTNRSQGIPSGDLPGGSLSRRLIYHAKRFKRLH